MPIDFPDFNLRLAGAAARRGVPVVYFVSPQVWAWRRGRVRVIRERVARMLVLFPFEVPFYEDAGVPVTFVGHPMAETEAVPPERTAALAARLGMVPGGRRLILLPGSRPGEVGRLLPRMLEAAALLRATRPDLEVVLPLARGLDAEEVRRRVAASPAPKTRIHAGDYPAVLTLGTAGIAASGTATLDAALAGLPTAVVYAHPAGDLPAGSAPGEGGPHRPPQPGPGAAPRSPSCSRAPSRRRRRRRRWRRWLDDPQGRRRSGRASARCGPGWGRPGPWTGRRRPSSPSCLAGNSRQFLTFQGSCAPIARCFGAPPMIRSMTGYGEGTAELPGLRVTVGIRSVNNRFADLRLRLPRNGSAWSRSCGGASWRACAGAGWRWC